MKHTGKIGHLSSIFMMENRLPAHVGMWDGLAFPMYLKSLIYNHKNTENEVCHTAENLENQEIRINTHTHTHTHTGTRASRYYKTFNYQRITRNNSVRLSPMSDNHLSEIQRSSVFFGTRRNGTFVRRHSFSGFPVSECRCLFPCGFPAKAPAFLEPKMKSCHEDYSRK